MNKTSAGAGTFAHAAEAAPFTSAAAFDPHKTNWAQPGGVERHRPVGGRVKRAIDVFLALLALVLLAPLILLVAILLRIGLGGPILVGEDHIGFVGRVFTAYTFRTSPNHRARKLARDPTIIAICLGTVRDSGLDRLPHLLSILRGDMSFVGPRPVTLDELDRRGQCTPDYFVARPGLVGLRRAHRGDDFGYGRRAALDRYYVRHWSIWLDLAVLASAVAAARSLNDAN